MPNDSNPPEKEEEIAALLERSLSIATQLLVARGGEQIRGANRLYDELDAHRDAARLVTVGLSSDRMQAIFDEAARFLNMPSIWPTKKPPVE